MFVEEVPSVDITDDIKVVEPKKLLTYYKKKVHSTDDCTAVQAARKLIEEGIDPIGRKELCQSQS